MSNRLKPNDSRWSLFASQSEISHLSQILVPVPPELYADWCSSGRHRLANLSLCYLVHFHGLAACQSFAQQNVATGGGRKNVPFNVRIQRTYKVEKCGIWVPRTSIGIAIEFFSCYLS